MSTTELPKSVTDNLNIMGSPLAEVVVVCDTPPANVWEAGQVMSGQASQLFGRYAEASGFTKEDFVFITPCPPMPDTCYGSAKRENAFISSFQGEFRQALQGFANAKFVLFLGATAGRQTLNRPIKITKIRGQIAKDTALLPCPAMGLLSPAHVLRRPELTDIYEADFRQLAILRDADWDIGVLDQATKVVDYEWCVDISELLANPPKVISLDIEYVTRGRRWYSDKVKLLILQISYKPGHALVIPMDPKYWPQLTYRHRAILLQQLRKLFGAELNIPVTGFNLKGDLHVLRKERIEIANWLHDCIQLVFSTDENMLTKSLSESTRRWIADMAGYSDAFDQGVDKNHMDRVPHADMLAYSGGDSDATLRLTQLLVRAVQRDTRQWNCYKKVQMPALRTFFEMEQIGLRIDKMALRALQGALAIAEKEQYSELISQVSPAIRRKHIDAGSKGPGTGLSFSRADFTIDCLFGPDGLKLKPKVFTDSTAKLPPEERVPSVSLKDHLPYFDNHTFVAQLIEYQQLQSMRTKYVGAEGGVLIPTRKKDQAPVYGDPTGFWKYFEGDDDRIHPSFLLHGTVTGRSSSREPNAQNFPKRGKLAKAFRKIFIPTEGYRFIEADLSQAEIRIAAWMANETSMIEIYANGGDIHEATAAAVMGIPLAEFQSWKHSKSPVPQQFAVAASMDCGTLEKLYKLKRYQAKAVNFGFLYGMGWRKFMAYAKTDYGITFTEQESRAIREKFFSQYARLPAWHKAMREFVQKHGYVRALHGALRNLPNILSPDESIQQDCERQAINSPVQRFASDIGLMGMSRFGRDCDWDIMRPVAFIHDAVVLEAKIGREDEAAGYLKWYMQSTPFKEWFGITPPIPIVSDVSIGDSLAEMEERSDIVATMPEFFRKELDAA